MVYRGTERDDRAIINDDACASDAVALELEGLIDTHRRFLGCVNMAIVIGNLK